MFLTAINHNKYLLSIPKYFIAKTNLSQVFTEKHVREYQERGATLVENVLSESECDDMIKQTELMAKKRDLFKKVVVFQTAQDKRGLDFLSTGDKTHFFFEKGVLDSNNKLIVPEEQAFNKIGHAMHDLEPYFYKFSYQPLYKYILQSIGYIAPTLVQSMYIYKNPKVGQEVSIHTDNTYLVTEPKLSCVGLWIALHDATKENGCMWGFPGSQKQVSTKFWLRDETNENVAVIGNEKEYDLKQAVPLEVKKGSMLVFHGDYLHYSEHNSSNFPRHAITLHFVETKGTSWSNKNWLQRNNDLPFKDFFSEVNKNVSI